MNGYKTNARMNMGWKCFLSSLGPTKATVCISKSFIRKANQREFHKRKTSFFVLFCIFMFGPCALFVGDELHLVWVSTFCNAFLSLFVFIDVGKVQPHIVCLPILIAQWWKRLGFGTIRAIN